MDDPQLPPPRAPSRTLVIVVVAALIAIAVAGIVITVVRGRSQAPAGATAPLAASAPTANAPKLTAADGPLNQIVFSADSDQMSPTAVAKIKSMAETAKDASGLIVISAKIEAANDRAARMDLAKKRANSVLRALRASGIAASRLRVEISEYPVGRVPAQEADRVEMNPR